jgi:hypothetical protein
MFSVINVWFYSKNLHRFNFAYFEPFLVFKFIVSADWTFQLLPLLALFYPPPFPLSHVPFPCAFWHCGPYIKSFICFVLFHYKLLIMYSDVVVFLPVLCLVPCPVFLWGPPGLLAAGACCLVGWGLRSLNAAFPCRSCLSYFVISNYISDTAE